MNCIKRIVFGVFSLAFVSSLQAAPLQEPASEPARQIARFTVWLDMLDKDLIGLTPEEAPDRLVASKSRAITFNLQALGRLYKSEGPEFKRLHSKFKILEDSIGGYQKWVDLDNDGRNQGVSEAVQARLTANRDAARTVLVNALIAHNFVTHAGQMQTYTQELRQFLNNYAWKDAATDRNNLIEKFIAELEEIRTTTYDFSKLEADGGVHDFRKKMRWISMETRGLNGLVTLKPRSSDCPVEAYANVVYDSIATTKYAVLPGSVTEPDPITLTPCLYVQIARLVEDVNHVKARAEQHDNLSEAESLDAVAPEDAAKVQKMLDDSLSNKLFERLQAEFRAAMILPTPDLEFPEMVEQGDQHQQVQTLIAP